MIYDQINKKIIYKKSKQTEFHFQLVDHKTYFFYVWLISMKKKRTKLSEYNIKKLCCNQEERTIWDYKNIIMG